MEMTVDLVVNRRGYRVASAGNVALLYVLRNEIGLNGPKYGCGLAQCGACLVLVDGTLAHSCVLTLGSLRGRAVTTLEGLAQDGALHPVQQAFIEAQGAQCGYCLNGMIMTTVALLDAVGAPTDEEIRAALKHNLCRCGAHAQILASVRLAVQLLAARRQGS